MPKQIGHSDHPKHHKRQPKHVVGGILPRLPRPPMRRWPAPLPLGFAPSTSAGGGASGGPSAGAGAGGGSSVVGGRASKAAAGRSGAGTGGGSSARAGHRK